MPNASTPAYLTAVEAADILRITPWQMTKLCRKGKVRASKPDGQWYITRAAIDEYVAGGYRDEAAS